MNNNKNSLLIKEACVDSFDQARKAEMLEQIDWKSVKIYI